MRLVAVLEKRGLTMATLILLRHGESVWNRQNRFTGWVDVSLSKEGIAEAERAAALLRVPACAGRMERT